VLLVLEPVQGWELEPVLGPEQALVRVLVLGPHSQRQLIN